MENKENAFIKNLNSTESKNKEVVDFSFMEKKTLRELEDGIKKSLKIGAKIQLSICVALYRIGTENLFAEYGYESLNEYIKKQTFLPQSTAQEYFYIGKYWIEKQNDLKQIGFTEEDGLSKLKFFPKNIDKNQKQTILEHLKNDSVRQFKQFISSLNPKNDTERPVSEKKSNTFDEDSFSDLFIEYFKRRKKNSSSSTMASLNELKGFIEYLTDSGALDKKLYNFILEQIEE
jgi:hypothetical protein